jgi:hypothetical protein
MFVTIRVINITKNVKKLFILLVLQLNLLISITMQVLDFWRCLWCTSWSIYLSFWCIHAQNVLDPFLSYCTFNRFFRSKNKLHQFFTLSLGVLNYILKPKEINRRFPLFSVFKPPSVPHTPSFYILLLKVLPVLIQRFFSNVVIKLFWVSLRKHHVKQTTGNVKRVSYANYRNFSIKNWLKWDSERAMRFFYPSTFIYDSFSNQTIHLESNI